MCVHSTDYWHDLASACGGFVCVPLVHAELGRVASSSGSAFSLQACLSVHSKDMQRCVQAAICLSGLFWDPESSFNSDAISHYSHSSSLLPNGWHTEVSFSFALTHWIKTARDKRSVCIHTKSQTNRCHMRESKCIRCKSEHRLLFVWFQQWANRSQNAISLCLSRKWYFVSVVLCTRSSTSFKQKFKGMRNFQEKPSCGI